MLKKIGNISSIIGGLVIGTFISGAGISHAEKALKGPENYTETPFTVQCDDRDLNRVFRAAACLMGVGATLAGPSLSPYPSMKPADAPLLKT